MARRLSAIVATAIVAALVPPAALPGLSPDHSRIVAPPGAAERHLAYADHAGTSADCTVYAADLLGRLTAAGIRARIVNVFASRLNNYDAHTFVEVRDGRRWAIQDPTFDGWWSIDGHPASAADLQNALARGRLRSVTWHGPATPLTSYYVNPLLLFHILDYRDGAASSTRVVPLPELYYASRSAPRSVAGVVVVSGGSGWKLGGYVLAQAPDGRFVSPIALLEGLELTGTGPGQVTTLQVPRFPASQIAIGG